MNPNRKRLTLALSLMGGMLFISSIFALHGALLTSIIRHFHLESSAQGLPELARVRGQLRRAGNVVCGNRASITTHAAQTRLGRVRRNAGDFVVCADVRDRLSDRMAAGRRRAWIYGHAPFLHDGDAVFRQDGDADDVHDAYALRRWQYAFSAGICVPDALGDCVEPRIPVRCGARRTDLPRVYRICARRGRNSAEERAWNSRFRF